MSEYETVRYDVADGIGWVTLNRPEVMNAFDGRMLEELSMIWRSMRGDDRVRCAVVTGAGDGMPSSYESMLMVGRMPLGELLRMQLTGAAERISAARAYQVGLVSEVVPIADLHDAAAALATTIAASPTLAVQATLKAVWTGFETGRREALEQGYSFISMGMTAQSLAEGQQRFASPERIEWRLR